MKKSFVKRQLKEALDNLKELQLKCKGQQSTCVVQNKHELDLYLKTWVIMPIQFALAEINRRKNNENNEN